MSRSTAEWIGASDDADPPARVIVRLSEKQSKRCAVCGRLLRPKHFDCDHITALINGGRNVESNLQLVCTVPCHSDKTKADVAEKSRTYRKRKANLGVRKPRTILQWRRFNGEPVRASRERT